MDSIFIYKKTYNYTTVPISKCHEMSPYLPIKTTAVVRFPMRISPMGWFPPEISGGYLPGMAGRVFQKGRASWAMIQGENVCDVMPWISVFVSVCVCVSMVHVYIMYIDIGFEINLVKVCSLLVVFLCTSWDIAWQARPNSIETTPQGAIHGKMFLKLYVMLQVSTIHGCPVPIDPIVTSDFGWFLVFQTNSSPKWISTGRPFWAAPQPGAGLSPRLQKQNSHPQKPRHTSAATQFRGHNWAQPILADTRQDHRESICKVELDVDVSIDAKFNKHSAVGHNFSAIVYSSQEKGLPSTSHLPKIDVFIFYKVPSRILILSRFLNPTKKSYSVRATP